MREENHVEAHGRGGADAPPDTWTMVKSEQASSWSGQDRRPAVGGGRMVDRLSQYWLQQGPMGRAWTEGLLLRSTT